MPKTVHDEKTSGESRTINIFLASSLELKEDREQFEIFVNRENKKLIKDRIFLELNLWEDFIDSMSKTRLQDEYNKAVLEADIFVCLFFTKVGKYTEEEFETAFGQFQKTGKPIIYTYFKEDNISTGKITAEINTLLKFQEKLKELGHYSTTYKNVEGLKLHFKNQLETLLKEPW